MDETAHIDGQGKKVFRYEQTGSWIKVEFRQLKKGDKFRIYNKDGEPVLIDSQEVFIAFSNACCVKSRWKIEVTIIKNNVKSEIYTPKWFFEKQEKS